MGEYLQGVRIMLQALQRTVQQRTRLQGLSQVVAGCGQKSTLGLVGAMRGLACRIRCSLSIAYI